MGMLWGGARDAATHLTVHRLKMSIVPRLGSPDLINFIKQANLSEIKCLVHDRAGTNPLMLKSKILTSPICSALRVNLLQV